MISVKLIIGAAILVVVMSTAVYISHINKKLDECKATVVQMAVERKIQNDAVEVLQKESDLRMKAGKTAIDLAEKATVLATKKAVTIYKTLPAIPSDDCKSALIMGNAE